MANRDVIMEAVRLSGRPLDDDELTAVYEYLQAMP